MDHQIYMTHRPTPSAKKRDDRRGLDQNRKKDRDYEARRVRELAQWQEFFRNDSNALKFFKKLDLERTAKDRPM